MKLGLTRYCILADVSSGYSRLNSGYFGDTMQKVTGDMLYSSTSATCFGCQNKRQGD